MLVLCMYVQPKIVKCQFLFPFFPNNSSNRQLSFRVKVLNHMGLYLVHKGMLMLYLKHSNMRPCTFFYCCVFAYFSKFPMYTWRKKRKNVSFTRVYVCVKAKLTFDSFFPLFFAPFPISDSSLLFFQKSSLYLGNGFQCREGGHFLNVSQ